MNGGTIHGRALCGRVGRLCRCIRDERISLAGASPANIPWQNSEDSTVVAGSFISQSLFHHKLNEREKKIAGPVVHYAFGASMAAAYGTIVELEPVTAAGWGIPFGIVVWLGAHVITVPALGLSEAMTRSTLPAEATEFAAHLVYGTVTEAVRRLVRSCVLP